MAEIINDYRTLLLHIPQQNVDASPEDYWEEGFVVIRECLAAAQVLLESNYAPGTVTGQTNSDEAEKVQLQRYAFFPTYFLVSCYCMLCLFSLLLSIYTNTTMGTDRLCVFRVILDSSARRFQAHRIYLRIAAAKRWALNRRTILRGQRPTAQNMAELNNVGNTLQQVGTSPSLPFPSWFSVLPLLWSGLANLFELGTGADNGSIRCLRSSSSRPAGRSLA